MDYKSFTVLLGGVIAQDYEIFSSHQGARVKFC